MDIKFLYSFQSHEDLQHLENNDIFISTSPKNKNIKKKLHITTEHKINLILNKLSTLNFNNIAREFVEILNQITLNEYEEFQKIIYIKIISETSYINLYLDFLELINYIYNKILNYTLEFFITSIEYKFKLDYTNNDELIQNNNKYTFLYSLNKDINRTNNLILLKLCLEYNIIKPQILNICEYILFQYNPYISDICIWKPILNENTRANINTILKNTSLSIKDKILLENYIK